MSVPPCCAAYEAGYACECEKRWAPGTYVRILSDGLPFEYGTVVEVVPEKGGCLVRPDGYQASFGWGFNELEIVARVVPRTRFDRETVL